MRKNKRVFSFLLICTCLFPLQAQAAGKDGGMYATREQTFSTVQKEETAYEEYVNFEPAIQGSEGTYLLQDISYKVIDTEYLDKKEKTVNSGEMEIGAIYTPKKTIEEAGVTYTLVRTEKEEKTVQEGYFQAVTSFTDYDHEVSSGDVLQTKTVTVRNEVTNQDQEVVCSFSGIESLGTTTRSNEMTITYQEYDAAYYEWNGNLIPRNDVAPALQGYEAQLLASVGASPESRITGIAWSGGTYTDGAGILCRDAVATVEQSVNRYRANYSGSIQEEAQKKVVYHSTYEGADPGGQTRYTIKATAKYRCLDAKTPVLPYVVAGVGIALLLAAIVTILMILAKRRKEERN